MRSLRLDTLDCATLKLLRALGNDRANAVFERDAARVRPCKPERDAEHAQRELFIRAKYSDRAFLGPREEDTPVETEPATRLACARPTPDDRLFAAAAEGDVATALAALATGASLDARRTRDGATPLHVAAHEGHAPLARLLLLNGDALALSRATDTRGAVPNLANLDLIDGAS